MGVASTIGGLAYVLAPLIFSNILSEVRCLQCNDSKNKNIFNLL